MVKVLALIAADNNSEQQLEALDACFAAAVFDINVCVLLLGNNVAQVRRSDAIDPITGKNLSRQWASAELYDIDQIYVLKRDMELLGLAPSDLIDAVTPLDTSPNLSQFDQIMSL